MTDSTKFGGVTPGALRFLFVLFLLTCTAAWRSKPSWVLVAAKDRAINPELERWYATRAKSHTVEGQGASHAVYVSKPKEVAALIEEAAAHAR
jgi:pimeloyl-ACP methyl ester carboxylesterase